MAYRAKDYLNGS